MKINAILIFTKVNFISRAKSLFGVFEKELKKGEKETVLIIKLPENISDKRLLSLLMRKDIRKAAIHPENEKIDSLLRENGVVIVDGKDVMVRKMGEIVKKAAALTGIKKGRAAVGIYSPENAVKILESLKTAQDHISRVFVYGKHTPETIAAAEDFFNETGISVIQKKKIGDKDCKILILTEDPGIASFDGTVISACAVGVSARMTVSGIRLDIPGAPIIKGIDDTVAAGLFGVDGKITKLICAKPALKQIDVL